MRIERDTLQATLIFDPVDALFLVREKRWVRVWSDLRFYVLNGVETATGQRRIWPGGLRLETLRNPSGYLLFFNRLRLPGGEPYYTGRLVEGVYTVEVRSTNYQPRRLFRVKVPRPTKARLVALYPGANYAFPLGVTVVRGTLHENPDDPESPPVAGAEVSAMGYPIWFRTSAKGSWVLWFNLPPHTQRTITLTATLPGSGLQRSYPETLNSGEIRSNSKL